MSDASNDPFADSPLFRELQRVLMSSSGPVNWELARQVAAATSAEGDSGPAGDEASAYSETLRIAELQVAGFTGLETLPGTSASLISRSDWVREALEDLKPIVEPSAGKVASALGTLMSEAGAGDGEGGDPTGTPSPMAGMGGLDPLSALTPLLMGAQAGTVIGYLAQNILAGTDLGIPLGAARDAVLVSPNVRKLEADWNLPTPEFRLWIAIGDAAARAAFGGGWARTHLSELIEDFASSMQPDLSSLRDKMAGIDPTNPDSMQEMLSGGEGLFGTVLDAEQRLKLARIQSFMAISRGYPDHIRTTLGPRLLGEYTRIEEAMRRHRDSETGDPVLQQLLGIEVRREHLEMGRDFCDRVARDTGEDVLARMWSSPDALPSMPEIEEPSLWMARTV